MDAREGGRNKCGVSDVECSDVESECHATTAAGAIRTMTRCADIEEYDVGGA